MEAQDVDSFMVGQGLQVEIGAGGKGVLASAYFQRSAFTDDALTITKIIMDEVLSKDQTPSVTNAVRLLQLTGAGMYGKREMKLVDESVQILAKNRDAGLICVSGEGMYKTRNQSSAIVTIELRARIVQFGVFDLFEDLDTYKREIFHPLNDRVEQMKRALANGITDLPLHPCLIFFDRFNEFAEMYNTHKNGLFQCAPSSTIFLPII